LPRETQPLHPRSVSPIKTAWWPFAVLAVREFRLKSVAVQEANAKVAAVVEGVNVFALKSLPPAVDFVNSPGSFEPIKGDVRIARIFFKNGVV
jgi:hypothetical protein